MTVNDMIEEARKCLQKANGCAGYAAEHQARATQNYVGMADVWARLAETRRKLDAGQPDGRAQMIEEKP